MDAEKIFNHPSIKREFERFISLGGIIKINETQIILYSVVMPKYVVETFKKRIAKHLSNLSIKNVFIRVDKFN